VFPHEVEVVAVGVCCLGVFDENGFGDFAPDDDCDLVFVDVCDDRGFCF